MTPLGIGTIVAVLVAVGLALLVANMPWIAASVFIALTILIFVASLTSEGFMKAVWEAVKRLVTGW